MPVVLEFPGPDDPGWANRIAREQAREELADTMTALAPMTRMARLPVPANGFAGVRIRRRPVGPVALVDSGGFDYCQNATAKTTDGVPEGISLAIRPAGRWSLSQGGIIRGSVSGDFLTVVDVTRAMRIELSANTWLWQMFFTADQLGLPVDAIRAAAGTVEHSPLRPLVASHVLRLAEQDLDRLAPEALHSIGQATIELVRAMLISAGRPEAQSGSEVTAVHLRHAVRQYLQLHLRDPGLCPESIARAHHISVRYLYSLWRGEEMTLARWIGRQRLEAARRDLADPRQAHKTIAAIAREWGFPSAAHFTRRFRDQYATSPREWRDAARRPSM